MSCLKVLLHRPLLIALLFVTPVLAAISCSSENGNEDNSSAVGPDIPGIDTIPPTIVEVRPETNAVDVDIASAVTVTFSEPLDPLTVNKHTFLIEGESGDIGYSNRVATFTPYAPLHNDKTYTVRLTTGIADKAGNNLSHQKVWSFHTKVDPAQTFTKVFGGAGRDIGRAVAVASDHGIVVVGEYGSASGGAARGWVMKLSATGSVEWDTVFESSAVEVCHDVAAAFDGTFVVGSAIDPQGSPRGALRRINNAGSVLWSLPLRYLSGGLCYAVTMVGLDKIAFAGTTAPDGSAFLQSFVATVGLDGSAGFNVRHIGSTGRSGTTVRGIASSSSSQFSNLLLAGWYVNYDNVARGISVDASLKPLWETFVDGGKSTAHAVIPWTSGGAFAGDSRDIPDKKGNQQVFVTAVNDDGSWMWFNDHGGAGDEEAFDMTKAHFAGYVVVGSTTSSGEGGKDVYMIHGMARGMEWERTFGGPGDDVAYGITWVHDGYIIVGSTTSFGSGQEDLYIIKTDKNGKVR